MKMKLFFISVCLAANAFAADDDFMGAPNFDLRTAMQSVGYMFYQVEGGESFCNLALIGERYAITNNHCMPSQKVCNSAKIYFTSDGEQITGNYSCTKLIATVDRMENGKAFADFSVFELSDNAGIYHGFFPLAKKTPSGEFKVWRIKYDPPGITKNSISINYSRCLAKKEMHPKFKEKYLQMKPNHQGEVCHLMQGNSGGAVLNNNGELLGVLSSFESKEGLGMQLNDINPTDIGGVLLERIEEFFPKIRDLNSGW